MTANPRAQRVAEIKAVLQARAVARQEAIRDELAVRHFADFVQRCWSVGAKRALVWAPYLQAVSDELEWLLQERARRVARRAAIEAEHPDDPRARAAAINDELGVLPPLRLVLMVPPGTGKSSLVNKLLPAWWLLHEPSCRFLALAASDGNVERDGLALRDVLQAPTYQRLQALAGVQAKLRDDQHAKKKFDLTSGGSRMGAPLGGRWIGADAEVAIIDDPVDIDDVTKATPARTRVIMDAVWTTYESKLLDRLRDALAGVVILIMQRLDLGDPAGRLADDGARVVCLPTEYEPDHPHRYGRPDMRGGLYAHAPDHPGHTAGDHRTAVGALLHPERMPAAAVERARRDPLFSAKHQQRPTAREGGQVRHTWLTAPHVTPYTQHPADLAATCEEIAVTVDASKKASGASYTSIQVWARRGTLYYLLDRVCRRMSYPEMAEALDAVLDRWPLYGRALIEDQANGTTYLQTRHGIRPRLVPFQPATHTPGKDKGKSARATYVEKAAAAGQVIPPDVTVCPWVGAWREAICAFPQGEQADDMDATAQLLMTWELEQAEVNATPTDIWSLF